MSRRINPGKGPAVRVIDLFAGIGGMRMGFEAAGARTVYTSEWNKYAVETYRANFPVVDDELGGDITKIHEDDVPDHDILLAGFPCQPFSIAGVSKKKSLGRAHGFADETQGTLFFDIARILAKKEPAAFVLENVKNLQSHDRGQTFETITRVLQDELGYTLSWQVVDAQRFLPQHRERIFIVGVRDGQAFPWNKVKLPPLAKGPRLASILHPEDGSEPFDPRYLEEDGTVHRRYALSPALWKYLRDYAAKHQAKGNGFGFGLVGPQDVARTLSARYHKDGSEILIKRPGRRTPRRLTPRECARLMGFETAALGAKPRFRIPVSDTQAYRQFGNAVAVPVVKAVARVLVPLVAGAVSRQADLAS